MLLNMSEVPDHLRLGCFSMTCYCDINLQVLLTCRSIDTKKGYKPVPNVRQIIQTITESVIGNSGKDWALLSLADPNTKYKVRYFLVNSFNY